MELASSAFADGSAIPRRFTCDGDNLSPPLQWSGAPAGTRSFVLLCDDPDAPSGTWHHWAAYDIPPTAVELAVGAAQDKKMKQAVNDFRKPGYGGPCPPHGHGPHRSITSGFSPSPRSTCECTAMRLAGTSSEKLVTIQSRKQPSSACIKDDLRRQRHGRSTSRGRVVVPAHVEGERVDRFELTIWRVSASGPMSAIRNSLMRRTRCAPGRGRTRN
jgi:Raf kinase inhibitor-like YbhB/YbcL family protein